MCVCVCVCVLFNKLNGGAKKNTARHVYNKLQVGRIRSCSKQFIASLAEVNHFISIKNQLPSSEEARERGREKWRKQIKWRKREKEGNVQNQEPHRDKRAERTQREKQRVGEKGREMCLCVWVCVCVCVRV